jgi:hypothetical protein
LPVCGLPGLDRLAADDFCRADDAHCLVILVVLDDAVVSELAELGQVVDAADSIRCLYEPNALLA